MGYSPWGLIEPDMTSHLRTHTHINLSTVSMDSLVLLYLMGINP